MHTYENPAEVNPAEFASSVVTVGVFDGLHLGHQALLSELCKLAARLGGQSIVITFRVHPRAVISKSGPTYITSLQHRLLLLEREGIDACLLLDFTPELACMTAEEFSQVFLVERLNAKTLLMGFDSRIGRNGEGDAAKMDIIGNRLGFDVRSISAVKVNGEIVSSTRIRDYILAGNLMMAEKMLGRPVTVLGTVVKGEGRGRKLGFPTANLDLHHEANPTAGVYGAFALFADFKMPALVSIGSQPTFHPENTNQAIEVHIPGFEGNLYGTIMEVRFIAKIRDQCDFGEPAGLVARMKKDVHELEQLLRDDNNMYSKK